MKKIISLVMVLVMATAVFSACGMQVIRFKKWRGRKAGSFNGN